MRQDQPMIGLLCAHETEKRDQYYVTNSNIQAIVKAGGIPILIPYQPKEQILRILEGLDALMIPGGDDVDPGRYGENPIVQCGDIDPHWDELDLWAAGFALERNMPILAICRGCQVLNVALGGTLIQDGMLPMILWSNQQVSWGVSGRMIPRGSTPITIKPLPK